MSVFVAGLYFEFERQIIIRRHIAASSQYSASFHNQWRLPDIPHLESYIAEFPISGYAITTV